MRLFFFMMGLILDPRIQAQTIDVELPEKKPSAHTIETDPSDIFDRMGEGVNQLFVSLSQHRPTSDGLKKLSYKYRKIDPLIHRSFALEYQAPQQNANLIRDQLQRNTANMASQKFLEQSEFYRELRKGLNLKIDFRNLLSNTPRAKPAPQSVPHAPKVRYGLVIKDVKINEQSRTASVSDRDVLYDATTPRTKVEWTIGPIIEQETNRPIFHSKVDLENEVVEDTALQPPPTGVGFSWLRKIEPSFVSNLKPAEPAKVGQTLMKGGIGKIDTITTISQTQGLYVLEWRNLGKSKSTKSAVQTFSVPIYEQLRLRQKFNLDFEETSTRLEGLLIGRQYPMVAVEYSYLTQQTIAESKFRIAPQAEIRLTAKNDAKKNLTPAQLRERKHRETYEAGITTVF